MKGGEEKMNKHLNECTSPHMIIHTITGLGIGLMLPILIPKLSGREFVLGAFFIILSMAGEFVLSKIKS